MGQLGSSSSSSMAKSDLTYTSSLDRIFQLVDSSVVQITSKVSNNLQNAQVQNATQLGSSFIYNTQGHLTTAPRGRWNRIIRRNIRRG